MEFNTGGGWLAVGIVIIFFLIPIPIVFWKKRRNREKDEQKSGEFNSPTSLS